MQRKRIEEKRGVFHFWAPEDFHNFFRAFLMNKTLVEAFLKPQYGGKPELYAQPNLEYCEDEY